MGSKIRPSPDMLASIINSNIGKTPVCIEDVLIKVYGRKRTLRMLKDHNTDPEVWQHYSDLEEMIDHEWHRKGVESQDGPFISC